MLIILRFLSQYLTTQEVEGAIKPEEREKQHIRLPGGTETQSPSATTARRQLRLRQRRQQQRDRGGTQQGQSMTQSQIKSFLDTLRDHLWRRITTSYLATQINAHRAHYEDLAKDFLTSKLKGEKT